MPLVSLGKVRTSYYVFEGDPAHTHVLVLPHYFLLWEDILVLLRGCRGP